MKKNKKMIMILLSLSIFILTVIPAFGMEISFPVKAGLAITVSDIPQDSEIFFIINDGVPIFAKANSDRSAKFLPLVPGFLKINVKQNGILRDSLTLNVGPGIIADGPAVVNQTLTVRNIRAGSDVLFILNDGLPIFSKPDSLGRARFMPLASGSLKINVMQNGILMESITVTVQEESPTTTPAPGTSGGGGTGPGTGGQGVNSKEPINNVAKFETESNSLFAGIVNYLFTIPELSIYQLIVTGKLSESNIAIKVESLLDTSKLVTEKAPGIIYKNINVWLGSNNIGQDLLRFKVENSWISTNNLKTSDINLFKWDGKWISLDTKEINKDDQFTYFEADGTGSTMFAISGAGVTGAPIPGITPGGTPVGTIPGETPTTTIPVPTKKGPGFEVIIAIIGIFLLYVILRPKANKKMK